MLSIHKFQVNFFGKIDLLQKIKRYEAKKIKRSRKGRQQTKNTWKIFYDFIVQNCALVFTHKK